jgi:hypothetical protein
MVSKMNPLKAIQSSHLRTNVMLYPNPKAFHVLSFLQVSPPKTVRINLPQRNCRMPIPPHCPVYYYPNNIFRGNKTTSNSLSEVCVRCRNVLIFYAKIQQAHCPNLDSEDHPLSAVQNCLINTFKYNLHISKTSPPFATCWLLYIVVLTHLTWNLDYIIVNSFCSYTFMTLSIHVKWQSNLHVCTVHQQYQSTFIVPQWCTQS